MATSIKGYTTVENVQAQLGRTLTAAQVTYLEDSIMPAAEAWVDATGGRAYGEGVVVAEQLTMQPAGYTWLSTAPVVSVEGVRGWLWGQTVEQIQLLPPEYYALIDDTSGQLYIPSYANYAYLEADYTPDSTVPAAIGLATSILCGYYMRTVVHPETEWLTDYSSGQDIRIKFRELTIPQMVYDLIESASGSVSGGYVIA